MSTVFHDDGSSISDFGGIFLVRCPRCRARAFVQGMINGPPARLICEACGLAKVKEGGGAAVGGPYDWFFHLPVWLQVPCAGHTLWAYNLRHVEFLESYVAAKLRLRDREVATIDVNKRLASRLPQWMTAGKNRTEIVHALTKLRSMATASPGVSDSSDR